MCSFPSPAIDHLVDYQKRSSENRIPSSKKGYILDSPTMPRTSRPPMRTANSNEIDQRAKYSGFQNRNKNVNSPLVKENFSNEDMEVSRAANGRYQFSGTNNYNNHQSAERMNGGFMNSTNPSSGFSMNEDFGQSPPPSSSNGHTAYDEFFDAAEDDLSECVSDDESAKSQVFGRSPSSRGGFRDVASRLHDEIVRRVAAEEALTTEKQKRIELLGFLNSIGASIPAAFIASEQNGVHEGERKGSRGSVTGVDAAAGTSGSVEEGTEQKEKVEVQEGPVSNEGEEAQEVIVARLVSTAIAKGVAAAAAKEELERVLARKEKEMSRLRDKMQFWERMNEELSNQTQENVELQRMRRRRRQRIQKVILAGLGVVLGVACSAAMAYAFSTLEGGTSSGSGSGSVTALEGGEVEVQSEGVTVVVSPSDNTVIDQHE